MDNDQRDRRDWPDQDPADADATDATPREEETAPVVDETAAAPSRERPADEPAEAPSWSDEAPRTPEEPAQPAWSAPEPDAAPAEIESWPSRDANAGGEPERNDPAWPTEPPAAGSAPDDAWPTNAPERGETPPPSEVEAYPAATTTDSEEGGAAVAAAHAVPEAEGSTGESTQCPRCGTENRPGLAFCRSCGQRLVAAGVSTTVERPGTPEGTTACPRCGTHNRAGVAFCQNCGANLRGTSAGYVPPAVAGDVDEDEAAAERRGAVLGPVVLLIGVIGLVTGYLLPFLYGTGSLFDRGVGADGYGVAFWNGYPEVGAALADQVYFGLAGPVPLLALLLVVLAVAGFVRARPGALQVDRPCARAAVERRADRAVRAHRGRRQLGRRRGRPCCAISRRPGSSSSCPR